MFIMLLLKCFRHTKHDLVALSESLVGITF